MIWVYYASNILTLPAEYGYVGVILITAFTYTLLRLRFVLVVLTALVGIAAYLPYVFTARYIVDCEQGARDAVSRLVRGAWGGSPPTGWSGSRAQLFLRQRELDQERVDPTCLLLNILPQAVVEQLKTSSGERIARGVRRGERRSSSTPSVPPNRPPARSPEEFAEALDALFRWFDEIADRHGLEKIKTIGDAYMAVAGAPVPMADHAEAAVAMARRDRRRTRCGAVAVRRPDQGPRWRRDRTGRRRRDRRAEVRLRRVGRHGEPREQAARRRASPARCWSRSRRRRTSWIDTRSDPSRWSTSRGKGAMPVRALLGPHAASDDGERSSGMEPSEEVAARWHARRSR